jgi:O-Antigen ligase
MVYELKLLIVVLGLSIPLFALLRSTALVFMDAADFKLRRNVWLILTTVAFIAPSFWVFFFVAAPLVWWAARRDRNPIALYLMLMGVIPPISVSIPPVLIQEIFSMDIFRLLSLCVLVPAALRIRKAAKEAGQIRGLKLMDVALLGFGAMTIVLYVPPDFGNGRILQDSPTNDVRSAFLYMIDVYALYYVASRTCTDQKKLREAMATFCLACALMALTAIFEGAKHWLLYTDINSRWGGNDILDFYYMRGDSLRAQASSGEPISLAFLLVFALGFWLYLQSLVKDTRARIGVTVLLCAGILVTFSRGAWLAGVLVYFAYAAFDPRGRLFRSIAVFAIIGAVVLASPLGDKISGVIPFLGGTVDTDTLSYRERLLDRSWELIKAKPIFGDQLALTKMEDLRQGQGIIDVVNAYVGVTLFYGFAGLTLFMTFVLVPLGRALVKSRRVFKADPDSGLLGSSLAAAIVASLLMLADSSLGTGPAHIFYILMGLAGAYAAVISPRKSVTAAQHSDSHATLDASLGNRAH